MNATVGRIKLSFGLGNPSLSLGESSLGDLPSALAHVIFRLGNERFVVKALGAIPIQLGTLGVGLGPVQVSKRSLVRGFGCYRVGLGSFQRGAGRCHIR